MSLLEMILYIADYIEPGRDRAPHLEQLRHLAFTDPERCVKGILYDTLQYLAKKPEDTDPMTAEAYKYYSER